jgi:hypothetical protein
MGFLVLMTIAVIFSTGVFIIIFQSVPPAYRLSDIRRRSAAFLREKLIILGSAVRKYAVSFRSAKRKEQIQKEIYSALSILRNYASADSNNGSGTGSGAGVTTDHILEQFEMSDGVLKEAYSGALRLLRTGRRSDAAEYFTKSAEVELARDFILLVLDWDAVPPQKLKQTVVAFQNALKETRTTDLIRKNEVLSDLVYMPVVTGVLVVFINFIYVAYFAEQQALFTELFF